MPKTSDGVGDFSFALPISGQLKCLVLLWFFSEVINFIPLAVDTVITQGNRMTCCLIISHKERTLGPLSSVFHLFSGSIRIV